MNKALVIGLKLCEKPGPGLIGLTGSTAINACGQNLDHALANFTVLFSQSAC